MGHSYSNITIREASRVDIAAALADRDALISPTRNHCTVVFDRASERANIAAVGALAARLSSELQGVALAALNHDDSILQFRLYRNGTLLDEYDSAPGYFDPRALPAPPTGGNAALFAEAFGVTDVAGIQRILHHFIPFDLTQLTNPDAEQNKYASAVTRHADLAGILGLPKCVAGLGFGAIAHGHTDYYGIRASEFLRTQQENM